MFFREKNEKLQLCVSEVREKENKSVGDVEAKYLSELDRLSDQLRIEMSQHTDTRDLLEQQTKTLGNILTFPMFSNQFLIESQREELRVAKDRVIEVESQLESQQTELSHLRTRVENDTNLTSQVESATHSQLEKLTEELQSKKEEISSLQDKIDSLTSTIASLQLETQKLNETIQTEIEEKKQLSITCASLRDQIDQLKEKLDTAQSMTEQSESSLKFDLNKALYDKEEFEFLLHEKTQEVEELNQRIASLQEDLNSAQLKLSTERDLVDDVQSQLRVYIEFYASFLIYVLGGYCR